MKLIQHGTRIFSAFAADGHPFFHCALTHLTAVLA
jgi:hypothetical protein